MLIDTMFSEAAAASAATGSTGTPHHDSQIDTPRDRRATPNDNSAT